MNTMLITPTRRAMHAIAEMVLAGPQYRASGTIRLMVTATGFRTVAAPDLVVDGVDLIADGRRIAVSGRSCVDLAATVGVQAAPPDGVYHDGSGVDAAEVLHLDPDAAAWIQHCWAEGALALTRLDPDQQPILWPEHFDVGILSNGNGFGVSPGDSYLPEPYAYVNPGAPRTGAYWNAPFGSARAMRELDGGHADAVLPYFVEGRRRAGMDPPR
jgi:hypothetical protein